MLYSTLLLDLKRYYFFAGAPDREANLFGLMSHLLNPRILPVILCRVANSLYRSRLGVFARLVSALNFTLFGIEIALRCEIGPGLCFPHTIGTVVGASRIGRNALIYHGVTLGAKSMDIGYQFEARPVVGDNVIIGSGAKVLGGVRIGNNVIIGANAVVTHDIPDNAIVGGIPARVLRHMEGCSD